MTRDLALAGVFELKARKKAGGGVWANIGVGQCTVEYPVRYKWSPSHGLVTFRIRPGRPLLPGDQIVNIDNIDFDFDPPVITEPSVLVATTGTGVVEQPTSNLRLAPNPAHDAVEVLGGVGDVQQARIFSAEGRLVRTFGPAQGRNRFPLQGLGAGTYILELIPSAGTPIRLPLIISHH